MDKRHLSRGQRAAVFAWIVLVCSSGVASVRSQPGHGRRPHPGADHVPAAAFGSPIPGLAATQAAAFQDGLESFTEIETMATGLGPVFNARSCGECHSHPAIGGAGPDLGTSRVTRIGRILNGVFDPLTEEGGMLL